MTTILDRNLPTLVASSGHPLEWHFGSNRLGEIIDLAREIGCSYKIYKFSKQMEICYSIDSRMYSMHGDDVDQSESWFLKTNHLLRFMDEGDNAHFLFLAHGKANLIRSEGIENIREDSTLGK